MATFDSIIEFAKSESKRFIDQMKEKEASLFMSKVNDKDFDKDKEVEALRIMDLALSKVSDLFEKIIEKMENGGND